jgi:hypothetical protein
MEDTRCRQFFLEPAETYHRQYEALRAFFIEGRRLKEIAQQFGYQESSLRTLVCRFRNQVKTHAVHPFLFSRRSGDRRVSPVWKRRSVRRGQRSPTAAS